MPPSPPPGPLVLTLTLDSPTQTFLTSLRSKYFPPHRNHLQAHLTLFHAIPHSRRAELEQLLDNTSSGQKRWDVFIGEPMKMGSRGVMVIVRDRPSATIQRVHSHILNELKRYTKGHEDELTNQDKQGLGRPHITILNKAQKEEDVDRCLEEVQGVFEEMKAEGQARGQKVGQAIGFEMWEYLQSGAWKPLKSWEFSD